MPEASTPKEFEAALKERRSKTTKALDNFFERPGQLKTHPIYTSDRLKKTAVFNDSLRAWAKNEFLARGVAKPVAFKHINQWPAAQKERLRKALVHAIENGVKVRFFWELYGGTNETTTITPEPLPMSGTITITFLSPQSRVRVSNAKDTFGEIFVDVGS